MSEIIDLSKLPTISPDQDAELAEEMSDVSERLVDRHLLRTTEWLPGDFITDHKGRSYRERPWTAERDRIMPVAAEAALRVNTLTEDNLTSYNHNVLRAVERIYPEADEENPLHVWASRWTAEEDRHGKVMGKWIDAHAAIDPIELDEHRLILMSKVKDGTPVHHTLIELMAYAAIQERATQISHRHTAKEIGDEFNGRVHGGKRMLSVIAGDEGRHHAFYRDWTAEAMDRYPSITMVAIARQLVEFEMPGVGIPNFERQAALIASAGIYNKREYRSVLSDVFAHVNVETDARYLTEEGQIAQLAIRKRIEKLDAEIAEQTEKTRQRELRRAARSSQS